MKAVITGLTLSPNPDWRRGLTQISLSGLPELLAVAGANGAGKTRLLDCIKDAVEKYDELRNSQEKLTILQGELESLNKSVLTHEAAVQNGKAGSVPQVESYKRSASGKSKEIEDIKKSIEFMAKLTLGDNDDIVCVYLGPKRDPVLPARTATVDQLSEAGDIAASIAVASERMGQAKRAIWDISQQYISATSSSVKSDPDGSKARTDRYIRLKELIELMLQTTLWHRLDCPAVLFDQPIDQANLSEGQVILLQFAVTLAGLEDDSSCVILLDEPETHLHPAAQIALVTHLAKALPNGQIILATHSVPLLAHVGAHRTLSMIDGAVKKVEKDVQAVLGTLIGDVDNVAKMRDFIDEADHLAAIAFAHECLQVPTTQPFKPDDPQQIQMMNSLPWLLERPLRLIDWGAGRGRLATALSEHFLGQGCVPSDRLDYFAYNPHCSDVERVACIQAMSALNLEEVESHFLSCEKDVIDEFNNDGADAIVLCNVLHEIDPRYWSDTFKAIGHALKEGGSLIIVEDLEIPRGEMAFPDGFFLVEKEGVAALFSCTQPDFVTRTVDDDRYRNRLMCYIVRHSLVAEVKPETVRAAIDTGRKQALIQLRNLRKECEERSLCNEREGRRRGRRHALYAQQVANATLFLETEATDESLNKQ